MLHGITPGPMLFENNQEIVYGLFVALFIATFMMLIMGWVSIKPLLRLVAISKSVLLSCILTLVFVGVYTHNGSLFDIGAVLVFGVIGYLMNRYGFSPAACVLGFVLGPMIELSFRRSLILSDGSLWIFGERPISLVLLVVAALTFAVPFFRRAKEVLKSPPSPP
jgi:putative tricarboxylic transport membrane protein